MIGTVVSTVQSIGTSMLNIVKTLPAKFIEVGKNIIKGLIDGIKSLAGDGVRAITDLGASIIEGAKRVFDINSPSKVMEDEVGLMASKGVAVGIRKGADEAAVSYTHLSGNRAGAHEKTVDFAGLVFSFQPSFPLCL